MDHEIMYRVEAEPTLATLLELLAQVNELPAGQRKPAAFPGLDSYVPSYVSSGADAHGGATWVIGTKY